MSSITPLPVVVPLAAAALILTFGSLLTQRSLRVVTVAAALIETALSIVLVHRAHSGTIVYWFGGWTPRHGMAIGVSFAVDRLGAGAAAFAGLIVTAATLTARGSFEHRVALTHALMLTMLAAMAGFCLTGDLFNLFVFYELMAVSAFGLAAYNTTDASSLRAALNFAITNSVGAFLFLIGIALLYGRTSALNLAEIGRRLGQAPHVDGLVILAMTTITVGLLVKAAIAPFHLWLVDIASWGPLPLVVVLGGALDTLAVYGLARVYWTAFAPALAGHDGALRTMLIVLGASSALLGGALALLVRGPRRILAFVMVSHTGTLLVGVGCLSGLGIAGAAVYAVAGGAVKAAIFACVGEPDGSRLRRSHISTVALLAAGGIALAGFPLFGISLGESVIERAAARVDFPWIAPVLILAAVLSGAAVLRIAFATARSDAPRQRATMPAVVATMLVGLAVGARFAMTRWVAAGSAAFVASSAYGRVVLDGVKVASVAGIGGVRSPSSSVAVDLLAVAGAFGVVAWLDWLRPRTRRHAEDLGATRFGNGIRRLHAGSLGDSVTWVTVGATAVAVALATSLR